MCEHHLHCTVSVAFPISVLPWTEASQGFSMLRQYFTYLCVVYLYFVYPFPLAIGLMLLGNANNLSSDSCRFVCGHVFSGFASY